MNQYVSIIIPTYNRAHLISRAIDSVCRQTHSYWELIVVDDGSTDGTQAMVEEYQKKDARIRYVKLPQNQGVSHARNHGVWEAKYDWIAFLDSDDEWYEEKLEKQLTQMDKEAMMSFCDYGYYSTEGDCLGVCPDPEIAEILKNGYMLPQLLIVPMIGTVTMLLKKDAFLAVGGFDEGLHCLEDYEFTLKFSKQFRICHVNEVLVKAHATEGSVSGNVNGYFQTRLFILRKYYLDAKENDALDVMENTLLEKARQFDIENQVADIIGKIKKEYGDE